MAGEIAVVLGHVSDKELPKKRVTFSVVVDTHFFRDCQRDDTTCFAVSSLGRLSRHVHLVDHRPPAHVECI